MWKIIAILGVGAPPGENPGSATALYGHPVLILCPKGEMVHVSLPQLVKH